MERKYKNSIYLFIWLATIPFLALHSGCKSTANVACTEVEKFQSNAGVLNMPHFGLGDVILLDTINKTAQYILHCQITPNNISATPPLDSTEILTSTGFAIDLKGKVSKADVDVQAQVKSSISNNTTFFLSNSVRKNALNPTTEINGVTSFPSIKSALTNNSNVICMFISGIVYANKFEFRVKKSAQVEANANIIKVGDFKVDVSYNCQGSLDIDAKNGGIFFKGTFFKLNSTQNQLVLFSGNIDLSKYKIVLGIR